MSSNSVAMQCLAFPSVADIWDEQKTKIKLQTNRHRNFHFHLFLLLFRHLPPVRRERRHERIVAASSNSVSCISNFVARLSRRLLRIFPLRRFVRCLRNIAQKLWISPFIHTYLVPVLVLSCRLTSPLHFVRFSYSGARAKKEFSCRCYFLVGTSQPSLLSPYQD